MALVALAMHKGLDAGAFLAGTSIGIDDLSDIDAEIPIFGMIELFDKLDRSFPGESLGLQMAKMAPASVFGAVGYAMRHAKTCADAAQIGVRYARILSSHINIFSHSTNEGLEIAYAPPYPVLAARHPMEFSLAMACRSYGVPTPIRGLVRVEFVHKPTGPLQPYLDVFGVEPEFEAPQTRIVLSPDLLALPLPEADAQFSSYLVKALEERAQLLELGDADLSNGLKACISHCDYRAEALAAHMKIEPRSLRRRLAPHGLSPRSIIEAAREENARRLLVDRRNSIPDVALLLGYSDERAFIRAFKRWTNQTPAAFRRAANGAG